MDKIKGKYLLTILAMCGLSAAAVGMHANTAGVFFAPVADSLGVGRGNVSLTLTISNLLFATVGLLVPRVYSAQRFKRNLIVFGLLYAVTTALHAAAPNLAVLYLLSAVRGLAGGLAGNVVVTIVINNWFVSNVGLISSIALGCSGICGAVFSPLLSAIISRAGWRTGYLAAGIIILILELPAMLLPFTYIPEASGLSPLGGSSSARTGRRGGESSKALIPAALFIPALAFAFIGSWATSYPQHFPGIADSFGRSAAVGSVMVSVCLLCNTCGKLIFGALADRFGTKISAILYIAVIAAGFLLMLLPGNGSAALFAGAAMIGLSYSLPTVGIVMLTNDIFGVENYARIFPKLSLCGTVAYALGSALIGFAYDAWKSYVLALSAGLVMILGGVVITVWLYRRKGRN